MSDEYNHYHTPNFLLFHNHNQYNVYLKCFCFMLTLIGGDPSYTSAMTGMGEDILRQFQLAQDICFNFYPERG